MCPVCITTAAMIAGSVTSTGGLAALAIRKFGVKTAVDNSPAQPDLNCFRRKNGAVEIVPDSHQRRN
jgi:hypothetical protein